MEMKPVTSSQIHAVGYDAATQKLRLQFLSGKERKPGSIYEYHPVPPELHAALVAAESIGKHFGANIKGNAAITFIKVS